MLEAADALADFEPEHPAEVTQDITEVPAPAEQADDQSSGPEPTLTDDPMKSVEDPQSEAVSAAAGGQSETDPAPVDEPMMDAAFESDAEIPAADATPDEPMLETAAIPADADADAEPAAVEGASDTAIMANAALLMSHEAALAAQAEAAEEARSDADTESAAANVASSTQIMVNVAAELMAHEEALAEQAEAALNDDRPTAPGPEPDPALVAASVDEPEPDTSFGTVGQDPEPAAEGDDEAPMLDLDWASETHLSIAEDAPADPVILPSGPPTGALDPLLATQTAQAQLTESTRIKSLSILDELGELEIAAAEAKDPMSDVPPAQAASGGSEGIDWSTWPVASEEQNPSETAAPESEMAPALESKPEPEPEAEPDQIEMATPQATAPATRPDPILAPVVGPLQMPPAQTPMATPAATAQPTIPAAPSQAPLAAPPTLTDVEPEAPTAPLAPTAAQAPATAAKPPAAAEPVPPVLTEVFQVTPREPSPATETAAATPPPAEAKPSAATVAPPAPSVPATPPPAATTPATTPASELDFSVLLEASDNQNGLPESDAPGGDVPVIVDPPALDPVDPELTNLAADVAQVTNLADLDELLAETLFGAEELEQLSAEIQAKQEAAQQPGAAAPAPPPAAPPTPAPSGTDTTKIERMAILAAMNGLGADDEDESGPKNAVG
jgi:Meckel syndrome type 1 protein